MIPGKYARTASERAKGTRTTQSKTVYKAKETRGYLSGRCHEQRRNFCNCQYCFLSRRNANGPSACTAAKILIDRNYCFQPRMAVYFMEMAKQLGYEPAVKEADAFRAECIEACRKEAEMWLSEDFPELARDYYLLAADLGDTAPSELGKINQMEAQKTEEMFLKACQISDKYGAGIGSISEEDLADIIRCAEYNDVIGLSTAIRAVTSFNGSIPPIMRRYEVGDYKFEKCYGGYDISLPYRGYQSQNDSYDYPEKEEYIITKNGIQLCEDALPCGGQYYEATHRGMMARRWLIKCLMRNWGNMKDKADFDFMLTLLDNLFELLTGIEGEFDQKDVRKLKSTADKLSHYTIGGVPSGTTGLRILVDVSRSGYGDVENWEGATTPGLRRLLENTNQLDTKVDDSSAVVRMIVDDIQDLAGDLSAYIPTILLPYHVK